MPFLGRSDIRSAPNSAVRAALSPPSPLIFLRRSSAVNTLYCCMFQYIVPYMTSMIFDVTTIPRGCSFSCLLPSFFHLSSCLAFVSMSLCRLVFFFFSLSLALCISLLHLAVVPCIPLSLFPPWSLCLVYTLPCPVSPSVTPFTNLSDFGPSPPRDPAPPAARTDFWTTRCVRCPAALDALEALAVAAASDAAGAEGSRVTYISINLDSLEGAREIVGQG